MRHLKYVPELDGLRGCAAIAVLLTHLFRPPDGFVSPATSLAWHIAIRIAGLGQYGVDVFFVLSGFLITSLLLADKTSPTFFRSFYWKRVLRIQPVYLVHLVATWFLIPGSHGYVILALLFIANFDYRFHVMKAGPAWTLSIEEQFYLLWPQLVRRLSIRRLSTACIVIMLASAGLRTLMTLLAGHAVLQSTWYRFDGLAMGGLLACQWIAADSSLPRSTQQFIAVFNSTALVWLAILYEVGCVVFLPSMRLSCLFLFTTNYLVYRVIRAIVTTPAATSRHAFTWLAAPPLVFFGTISYALYMYHGLWIYVFDRYLFQSPFGFVEGLKRTLFLALTALPMCILSLHLIEKPIQRLRRYFL